MLQHSCKTGNIGVVAKQTTIRLFYNGIHTTDFPGFIRKGCTIREDVFFIGNGHVDALEICFCHKSMQFIARYGMKHILILRQLSVNLRGIAMPQFFTDQAVFHDLKASCLSAFCVSAKEDKVIRTLFQFTKQINDGRIDHVSFEVEEETEFEFAAGNGTAFQLGQVYAGERKAGNDAVESAGFVGQIEHDGNFTCIMIYVQIPCDANETGEIVLHIADVFIYDFKAVQFCTDGRSDNGNAVLLAICCEFSGNGCIFHGFNIVMRMLFQIIAALAKRLFMGHDFCDRGGVPFLAHQAMINSQPACTDDMESVLLHQVIDLSDGAGCAVFKRKNAVSAHAFFYGTENIIETVEIQNGGISKIRIIDNGMGISKDDMEFAFERHATSKIRNADDLETVKSMGFRGEALASIISISRLSAFSRTKDYDYGYRIDCENSETKKSQTGCAIGTVMEVKDLFYNLPVRQKFLKNASTEFSYIAEIAQLIALSNPSVSIILKNNNSEYFRTSGSGDLKTTICEIYTNSFLDKLKVVNKTDLLSDLKITGFAATPDFTRSSRKSIITFINGRVVKCQVLSKAIETAYKSMLPIKRYPFVVVNLEIPTSASTKKRSAV